MAIATPSDAPQELLTAGAPTKTSSRYSASHLDSPSRHRTAIPEQVPHDDGRASPKRSSAIVLAKAKNGGPGYCVFRRIRSGVPPTSDQSSEGFDQDGAERRVGVRRRVATRPARLQPSPLRPLQLRRAPSFRASVACERAPGSASRPVKSAKQPRGAFTVHRRRAGPDPSVRFRKRDRPN